MIQTLDALTSETSTTSLADLGTVAGDVLIETLVRARPQTPYHLALWEVAAKYGCHRDGGFVDGLTRASVASLVAELRDALLVAAPESSDDDRSPPSIFDRPEARPANAGRPYSDLLAVMGRPDRATDLAALVWYTLKHRLNVLDELYPPTEAGPTRPGGRRPGGRGTGPRAGPRAAPRGPLVLDGLIALLESLDVTARAEALRLLLDRRCLVPFVVPRGDKLAVETDVLGYVNTVIATANGVSTSACLMTNTTALRVAVVSDRPAIESCTKDWIKDVFNVTSFHYFDRTHGNQATERECVAEMGWGFIADGSQFQPVMVLHVVGDYHRLDTLIHEFADAVVVDAMSEAATVPAARGGVLKWYNSLKDEGDEFESEEGAVVTVKGLWCGITTSYNYITTFLTEFGATDTRVPVAQLNMGDGFVVGRPRPSFSAELACQHTSFETLRRTTFKLQRQYIFEAQLEIKKQQEMNVATKQMWANQIKALKANNAAHARAIEGNPLLQYFVQQLQLPCAVQREMAVLDLEQQLALHSDRASREPQKAYRAARDALNRVKNDVTQKACNEALEAWSLTVTGIEHLWRELSHMFVAKPNLYSTFPELAVVHLLDGFPIELMDGDAAMVNMTWFRAILNALEVKLPQKRIFVLSIMGVQSSGKSTLLNYMFGVRLRTSVSRCTRGVNVQLLECAGRDEYDYILLLDTEGVRAPEFLDMEGSVWRDNRMATLAILPADATIILTKGESIEVISQILPIVLSVFLDSKLVEDHRSQLASKFYFVFNQINTGQATNMETIVHTLLQSLRENARKVQEIRGLPPALPAEAATEYFTQFKVDVQNPDASDVRFLGTIQGSSEPPKDVPDADYGKRLLKFRDYIHLRASQDDNGQPTAWLGRTIGAFNDDLQRVWDCINSANFQMNFIAAHERVSYDEMVHMMTKHKQDLAKVYSDAFDVILQAICADKPDDTKDEAATIDEAARIVKYQNDLVARVQSDVFKLDTVAVAELDATKYQKWQNDQLIKWDEHKTSVQAHAFRLIHDKVTQVFCYDAQVKVYENALQSAITQLYQRGGAFELTDAKFEQMFANLMCEVQAKYPVIAPKVPRLVHALFTNQNLFHGIQLEFLDAKVQAVRPAARSREPGLLSRATRYLLGPDTAAPPRIEDTLVHDVKQFVLGKLATAQRYQDEVAVNCILETRVYLNKLRVPNKHIGMAIKVLYDTMIDRLYEVQQKWDAENNIAAKFATCKGTMQQFARNLCLGHKAADLLIESLKVWLQINLAPAVAEQVVAEVAVSLKPLRWVSEAKSMQAWLDNDLIDKIKKKDITGVLEAVKSPKTHGDDVVTKLIQEKVQERFTNISGTVVAHIRECLASAAAETSTFRNDLAKRFVKGLGAKLSKCLKKSGTSVLVKNLPTASDDVMNCDHQGPTIFSTNKDLNVLLSTLKTLDGLEGQLRPSSYTTKEIADAVRKLIRDEAYGAASGVIPRCSEPCPRCGCPCTKDFGHTSNKDDAVARHDTYHQPMGIVGVGWEGTQELVAHTCPGSVEAKHSIKFQDGSSRPYSEFDQIYTGWAMPTFQESLPLREYIFAMYQGQLATNHGKAKCTSVPAEFSQHDLKDLTKKIRTLLY